MDNLFAIATREKYRFNYKGMLDVGDVVEEQGDEKGDECGGVVNEYELEGRACYAGLVLSSTSDLTAMVLVFPPRDEEEEYIIIPHFWLPE